MNQNYLVGNPFATLAPPASLQQPLDSSRALSFAQWDHVDALLQAHADTEARRRLRRGMRWLYATGLRLAEITSAKCEDLEQIECRTADGAPATGWQLVVAGKGGRCRRCRCRRRWWPSWKTNSPATASSGRSVP